MNFLKNLRMSFAYSSVSCQSRGAFVVAHVDLSPVFPVSLFLQLPAFDRVKYRSPEDAMPFVEMSTTNQSQHSTSDVNANVDASPRYTPWKQRTCGKRGRGRGLFFVCAVATILIVFLAILVGLIIFALRMGESFYFFRDALALNMQILQLLAEA